MRNFVRSKLSSREKALKELCIKYNREDLLTSRYGKKYKDNDPDGADVFYLRGQRADFVAKYSSEYDYLEISHRPMEFNDKMTLSAIVSGAVMTTLFAAMMLLGHTGHMGAAKTMAEATFLSLGAFATTTFGAVLTI